MLQRYGAFKGYDTAKSEDLHDFTDADRVSPGRWMQSVGLWRKASFAEGATGFWMQQDESLVPKLPPF